VRRGAPFAGVRDAPPPAVRHQKREKGRVNVMAIVFCLGALMYPGIAEKEIRRMEMAGRS